MQLGKHHDSEIYKIGLKILLISEILFFSKSEKVK